MDGAEHGGEGGRSRLRLWLRRLAGAALLLALCAVAGLVVMGFGGRAWWRFDVLASFRVQYAVAIAVLVLLLLALRWWRTALVGLAVFAVNAVPLAPMWLGAPDRTVEGPTLTVLFHNLHDGGAYRLGRLEQELRRVDADVVVLGGLTGEWAPLLADADLGPYELRGPTSDTAPVGTSTFRLAVLSRVPVRYVRERTLGDEGRSSGVELRARLGGGDVAILGVRTRSPRGGVAALARDRELVDVAGWAARQPVPAIVVGDLNVTPWSSSFQDLLDDGGLHDSSRGFGWQPTWPDPFLPLMIPLDHALLGEDLVAVDRRTGPSLGSEHRSLLVEVGRRRR